MLVGGNSDNHSMEVQERPKLEDFLGGHSFSGHDQKLAGCNDINNAHGYGCSEADYNLFAPYSSYHLPTATATTAASATNGSGENGSGCMSGSIGLSMIKSWLRNQPAPVAHENQGESSNGLNCNGSAQTLSLSMGTGSQLNTSLPLLAAASASAGGGERSGENKSSGSGGLDGQSGAIVEAVPRKSIDTFGQRTSIYRGVTRLFTDHRNYIFKKVLNQSLVWFICDFVMFIEMTNKWFFFIGIDGLVGRKLICGIIAVEGKVRLVREGKVCFT